MDNILHGGFASKLASCLDYTPMVIYLKDLAGNILWSNQVCADRIKEGDNIVNIYPEVKISKEEDWQVIKNKKYIIVERNVQSFNAPSGWFRIIKSPLFDTKGNVNGIIVLGLNIDREKEVQDKQNTFIATLTHDFKTPISAQIRVLDLLLDNSFGNLTESQVEILSQIKESCGYMQNLVHNALTVYLCENGELKLKPENFDWSELIDFSIKEVEHLLDDKELKIKNMCQSLTIFADKVQLKRAITNLISNAITYSVDNTTIEITSKLVDNKIEFCVKNKSNISVANLDSLFEKFRCNSKISGAGLGLYMVKQVITAHEGSVFAKSDRKKYYSFGFSIPICPIHLNKI